MTKVLTGLVRDIWKTDIELQRFIDIKQAIFKLTLLFGEFNSWWYFNTFLFYNNWEYNYRVSLEKRNSY